MHDGTGMKKTSDKVSNRARRRFLQGSIALVYDFDGTLTPKPMQNYTVLAKLGISADEFWNEVNTEVARTGGDHMLTYMRLIVDRLRSSDEHITRDDLRRLATDIEYFPGVETWFERVNRYVERRTRGKVRVRHYLISAGLREILEGVSIRHQFRRIYASQYFFDKYDRATFPTIVINDTAKTQYLFRINKGIEDPRESINDHMPEQQRPIPFGHMLYIGDGMTDVPCMTVAKKNGGFAVAVYQPKLTKSLTTCQELARADRIDYFAPADYREGRTLERRVQVILDVMIARILFERERFALRRELD